MGQWRFDRKVKGNFTLTSALCRTTSTVLRACKNITFSVKVPVLFTSLLAWNRFERTGAEVTGVANEVL